MSKDPDNHDVMGRIGGLAVIDVLATATVAVLLGNDTPSRLKWFGVLFVVGEIVHVVLKKETPITKRLV